MEAFEYAIKKDVRNNPIIREVDHARQQEQWKWVGVAALLTASALLWAWPHFGLLQYGYQLDPLQHQRADEEATARQIRLEIETLRSPKRIEAVATQRLHLVAPSRADAIVLERVVPAEPPASNVVARR